MDQKYKEHLKNQGKVDSVSTIIPSYVILTYYQCNTVRLSLFGTNPLSSKSAKSFSGSNPHGTESRVIKYRTPQ